MKNPLLLLIIVSLVALLAPQLFVGWAAAVAVGWWISRSRKTTEPSPYPRLRPVRANSRRSPIRKQKLQARVAAQYHSSNPMLRNHAREVARCLLGLKRSEFERMNEDQVVEALLNAPRLA